nr:tetratricopeptide repeat protein [Edaphobacter modestus]
MQHYADAVADLRSALRLDGELLSAHYNLALSLIRLQKINEALEQLRIVIAAQPNTVQPRYNMAILLESKNDFAGAKEQLVAARSIDPQDAGVAFHLLVDELKLKHDDDVPALVDQLAAASTAMAVQQNAATALLEAGSFQSAVSLLQKAHERDPKSNAIVSLLCRAYIGAGSNSDAIALASDGTFSNNEEMTYLLALAYAGNKETQRALETFTLAAQQDTKDARPLYHLGLIAAATPQGPANAVQFLRSAHRLDLDNAIYALALVRILLVTDQAEEARAVLITIKASGEDQAQVDMLSGVALAATHQGPEAAAQLKKAIAKDPSLAVAHNVLGFCFFQQGQYAQAAEAYGKASELDPRRVLYAQDAALAYGRANQIDHALRYGQRASSLEENNANSHALVGKLYASAGRREDAVRELRLAVELNPDKDSALYLLARTYQQMGDQQQALEWSEKLRLLKQQHEAAFSLQKKTEATSVRSSTLLEGGSAVDSDASAP